jgi:hypothetical protein
VARSFLLSNPEYWRGRRRSLPLWFTLTEIAHAIGVARNSALWYVTHDRLVPTARTASDVPLFSEDQARKFIRWHKTRPQQRRKT